ncbi:MAG: DUF393 domain-containing protein [Phycisphaerales bacterium]|nr:DUF393 domain-containing protein [Phycisphaerales bacterium]
MAERGGKITMYYDGRCGVCRAGVKRLGRLDWLGALEPVDYTSLAPADRPVEESVFMRGMPLRTRDGRVLIGFPAIRHAFIHTPLGWLLGWLLYVPGISHLGRLGYDAFAKRRPRDAAAPACRVD